MALMTIHPPNPTAQLPDPFTQVKPIPGASIFGLSGLDRTGEERAILDLGLAELGRPAAYTGPVGAAPEMTRIILDQIFAREAEAA